MPDPLVSLLIAALVAAMGLLFFWPDQGLFWRWQRVWQITERMFIEDALKHIHESEMSGRHPTLQSIAGALQVSDNQVADLLSKLEHPTYDPHGDPIPTADGKMVVQDSRPLTALAVDQPARIVHLEDEPPALYAQLVAEELHPGMQVRVTEISPQRVRFWANGDEHVLAPVLAANVAVIPLPEPTEVAVPVPNERLTDLRPGEKATVVGISPACRGTERRRFLDLGILPGTAIEAEMISPSGDPIAYRVRGTLLALRRDQANHIYITRQQEVV